MVDKERLTDLIVHNSEMSREEVEDRMTDLIKNINDAERSGESFALEGFGTFKTGENGTYFEPDEVLQTEINQKYAGMKPIELMGSFKETGTGGSIDISDRPKFEEREPEPVPESEPREPEKPEEPEIIIEAGADVEEEQLQKEAEQFQWELSEEESKDELPVFESETTESAEENAPEETAPGGVALIAASVVVAILLGAWLFYNMGIFGTPFADQNGNSIVATRQTQKPEERLKNNTESLKSAEKSDVVGNTKAAGPINMDEEDAPLFGLRGPVQADAKDGYTIVVHSLRIKPKAVRILNKIQQKGFRAMMMKAVVNGTVYWRLGIGQFKTVDDAQKAARKLPSPYKEKHFIIHQ